MNKSIMLFAAGLGTRMKHITEDIPKPLIKVRNKPLLYWNLDFILKYNFTHLVINIHYMPHLMEEAINEYFKDKNSNINVKIMYEPKLLETGGGLKNALDYLPGDFIFTLHSDIIIIPQDRQIFESLENSLDPKNMDLLLLLNPKDKAIGYTGKGDFNLGAGNQLLKPEVEEFEYMYSGLQIIKRKLIEDYPQDIFSLGDFYKAQRDFIVPKAYGLPLNDLTWIHLTNPENIQQAENRLSQFYL